MNTIQTLEDLIKYKHIGNIFEKKQIVKLVADIFPVQDSVLIK